MYGIRSARDTLNLKNSDLPFGGACLRVSASILPVNSCCIVVSCKIVFTSCTFAKELLKSQDFRSSSFFWVKKLGGFLKNPLDRYRDPYHRSTSWTQWDFRVSSVLKSEKFPKIQTIIEKNLFSDDSSIFSRYFLFEKESVCLETDADGNAVFRDLEGVELYRGKADGQSRYFSEFYCKVKDGVISVKFPIQEVVDHYPNCDGEYDRLSAVSYSVAESIRRARTLRGQTPRGLLFVAL